MYNVIDKNYSDIDSITISESLLLDHLCFPRPNDIKTIPAKVLFNIYSNEILMWAVAS